MSRYDTVTNSGEQVDNMRGRRSGGDVLAVSPCLSAARVALKSTPE